MLHKARAAGYFRLNQMIHGRHRRGRRQSAPALDPLLPAGRIRRAYSANTLERDRWVRPCASTRRSRCLRRRDAVGLGEILYRHLRLNASPRSNGCGGAVPRPATRRGLRLILGPVRGAPSARVKASPKPFSLHFLGLMRGLHGLLFLVGWARPPSVTLRVQRNRNGVWSFLRVADRARGHTQMDRGARIFASK